jgi:NADH-quinone oxidoreductase subunit L
METILGIPTLACIPLLPLVGALINLTLGRRLGKRVVTFVALASVVAAFGLSFYLVFWPLMAQFKGGQGDQGITKVVWHWLEIGNFKADLAFHLDTLSAVMILIITFIGSLIHLYSVGYMADDPGYHRYFGYLNLFTGAMLILVLAGNLPVMFIGWEGVGLCSFLLIGFWYENEAYANAGRKAFVVNRIGDFCFLLGMFLLFWAAKTLDFDQLKDASKMGAAYVQPFWGHDRLSAAAGILLFIGACGKSAQIPLYVWLPDAMAGPTPVSALIHAATMVTAGVYMVCRLSFLYSTSTTALAVVAVIGLCTALAAAFMAFAQTDLKKVLAYSTVSQLGFMFVAAGTGNWLAAMFHLGTHAFFKACLFLGAGSVMHGMEHGMHHTGNHHMSSGDITKMGGLRKHMPITRLTFMVSCLAIAGIFPFAGFFSKDEILAGAWGVHPPGWPPFFGKILWGGLLIAALGTAFYMWRLYFLVFGGDERSPEAKHAHESPLAMTVPLIVLAIFATFIGFIGVPHLEHTHVPAACHALASWLEPSTTQIWYMPPGETVQAIHAELTDNTTMLLMGIALMIGVVGIIIAWMLYGRGPSPTVEHLTEEHGALHGAYEASKNKLWVDEIYDVLFVRPFRVIARGLYEVVDRFIIDTVAVNGLAFVIGLFGRVSRWIQNGNVQRYLAGLTVGAACVFLVTDCHSKPTFEINWDGNMLHLHAEPGSGISSAGVKLRWDTDGDGTPDVVEPNDPRCTPAKPPAPSCKDVTVRAGDTGEQITLYIDDPISQKPIQVTRAVPPPPTPPATEVKP